MRLRTPSTRLGREIDLATLPRRASGPDSPDAVLPTLAAGSADASTSPRPPGLSSRTTQTRPVLCQPVHKAGDYQWLSTDAFHPDLTLYVSCFDEADARTRP